MPDIDKLILNGQSYNIVPEKLATDNFTFEETDDGQLALINNANPTNSGLNFSASGKGATFFGETQEDGILQVYGGVRTNNNGITIGDNRKIHMWEDSEGGNLSIYSPSGQGFNFDAYSNDALRLFRYDNAGGFHETRFNRDGSIDNNGHIWASTPYAAERAIGVVNAWGNLYSYINANGTRGLYSSEQGEIVTMDVNGNLYLGKTPTIVGHSGPIGQELFTSTTTAIALAPNGAADVNLLTLDLPAGSWMIAFKASTHIPTAGRRWQIQLMASNGNATVDGLNTVASTANLGYVALTSSAPWTTSAASTTFYLQSYCEASGATLRFATIRAVRIA